MGNDVNFQIPVGEQSVGDGVRAVGRAGRLGEQMFSSIRGRYSEQAQRGNIFFAQAIVTAPVIWTTEAGTGGPLLWNNSSSHVANILAVGWGTSTVSTVAAALGLTGGYEQTAAPTSTTAIDSSGSLYVDASTSRMNTYRVGTTGTNRWFLPFGDVMTGALTTVPGNMNWVWLDGLICVPRSSFVSVAASATATSLVANICLVWEEVPV